MGGDFEPIVHARSALVFDLVKIQVKPALPDHNETEVFYGEYQN